MARKVEEIIKALRDTIRLLVTKAPVTLNTADFKGQTPLMLVAENGDAEFVEWFLSQGANPTAQDYQGMTALHSAIKSYDNDVWMHW